MGEREEFEAEIKSLRKELKKAERKINRLEVMNTVLGETNKKAISLRDFSEKELLLAKERAECADRAKTDFLTSMSHEIRTPLNAILGMNKMIMFESCEDKVLAYAESVDSSGKMLLSLINDVLDFSKIESGKMELICATYSLTSMLNDIVGMIKPRADSKNLSLEVHVNPDLPDALYGDEVRIRQIVINLLTNAVKYTDKGTVSLYVTMKGPPSDDRVALSISVRDTGKGIHREDLEHLFDAFARADEKKNRNIEGTGLGLSITKKLVSLMEGEIGVESEYGEGSNFFVTISQQVMAPNLIGDFGSRVQAHAERKGREDLLSVPSAEILVVDDNEMNLKVVQNLFKLCGVMPDVAFSGAQAIACMRRKKTYDIVFLDHMMPEMDGLETLQKLLEEDLVPENTVMVALTANAVLGARETYLKAGFRDYLSKPIEIKKLMAMLEMYLPEKAYREKSHSEKTEWQEDDEGEILEFAPVDEEGAEEKEEKQWEAVPDFTAMRYDDRPGSGGEVGGGEDRDSEVIEFGSDEIDDAIFDLFKLSERGFNVEDGLSYCGEDERLFFDVLDGFVANTDTKAEELNAFYEAGNWHDYEVKVHALKSNAGVIGAKELAAQAFALEQAARNRQIDKIYAKHGELLTEMKRVSSAIYGCRKDKGSDS